MGEHMISATLIQAADGDANPLVPNPWEALVALIGFVVLLFVVIKWIWPAFEKAYQNRVEAIEGGLNQAEEAKAEAEALKAEYEQNLADARAEASRIVGEALEDEARSQRVVDRFLADLDAEQAGAAQ